MTGRMACYFAFQMQNSMKKPKSEDRRKFFLEMIFSEFCVVCQKPGDCWKRCLRKFRESPNGGCLMSEPLLA